MKIKAALVLTLIFCSCKFIYAQTITTFAGSATSGYSGDGGPATLAQLYNPFSIAFDGSGNVYFADRLNNCIRKVNGSGIINTVCGTGTAGYNGDSIAATSAQISNVGCIAIDVAGNIYIADKGNNRIRKIDLSGTITTVAGNGTAAFSGDGANATAASLNSPRGIAVDAAGNLYIADQGNNRLRKVNATGIISTIAGTTTAGYNGDGIAATTAELKGPYCVAISAAGNIYIADVDNYRIRKIDAAGIITTVAGNGTMGFSGDGGPATAAQLNEGIGIALDTAGNLIIADGWNERVRWVNTSGIITTIAGNGTAGYGGDGMAALAAQFNNPYGVAINSTGDLFIADYANSRIRRVTHPLSVSNPTRLSVSFNLSPNPSSGSFSLTISGRENKDIKIIITNSLSRKVKELFIPTNKPTHIILNEPSGIYYMSCPNELGALTEKIVVAR